VVLAYWDSGVGLLPLSLCRFAFFTGIYLCFQLAFGKKEKTIYCALRIFFILYVVALYLIMQQSLIGDMSFVNFITPLFLFNVPDILLIGALRLRSIKAIGIFIYSFFVICTAGPMLMIYVLSVCPDILEIVGYRFIDAGFSASGALWMWLFLSFAVIFILGWFVISSIRTFYVRRYINDLQLNADAMFVIFNIVYSLFISFGSITYALISLLAFPICKLTGYLLFFILRKSYPQQSAPRMLILRVFALGDESRNLFERTLRHWR